MLKQVVAGVVASVILTGAPAAGPFEDAEDAYNRGDYATALRLWQPLAEEGDVKAQFNLGLMYEKGEAQDYAEAARWYRLAARQGYADAQNQLGLIYGDGRGVATGLCGGRAVVPASGRAGQFQCPDQSWLCS